MCDYSCWLYISDLFFCSCSLHCGNYKALHKESLTLISFICCFFPESWKQGWESERCERGRLLLMSRYRACGVKQRRPFSGFWVIPSSYCSYVMAVQVDCMAQSFLVLNHMDSGCVLILNFIVWLFMVLVVQYSCWMWEDEPMSLCWLKMSGSYFNDNRWHDGFLVKLVIKECIYNCEWVWVCLFKRPGAAGLHSCVMMLFWEKTDM